MNAIEAEAAAEAEAVEVPHPRQTAVLFGHREAEGTLLGQFNIVVDTLPPHPTPLWARF